MKRMVFILASLLAQPAIANEAAIREMVLANVEHTLWHEVGHGLISEFALPVVGQEEDAVDAFATLMMLADDDAARLERLLDVAEMWMVSHEQAEADGLAPDYYAEHDLDAQRGLRVICFIAGEGPGRAHELVDAWGLPEDRAETCEDDYGLALDSWDALLEPYWRADDRGGAKIKVTYGDDSKWKSWLVKTEIMEFVADHLRHSWDLDPGLALRAEACGEANAFWDPQARTITLCYELLTDYENLARAAQAD